jgi:protein-S-isoprenylcysteine O-methyltransferase Ste14
MENIMSTRTIYMSRLIGLYCIVVIPSLVIHKQATVDSIMDLFNSPSLMLFTGIIAVAVGLAMILAHNIWTGGALPVVVTVVGWLSLIKGLMFLLLPSGVESEIILNWLRNPLYFYLCMTPSFLIGVYLAYEGFRPRTRA